MISDHFIYQLNNRAIQPAPSRVYPLFYFIIPQAISWWMLKAPPLIPWTYTFSILDFQHINALLSGLCWKPEKYSPRNKRGCF